MRVYYDLHIHSCLSPCGDADMTPNNIVNMARLAGLSAIALTDHNACGNWPGYSEGRERERACRPAGDGTLHIRGGPCDLPLPHIGGSAGDLRHGYSPPCRRSGTAPIFSANSLF